MERLRTIEDMTGKLFLRRGGLAAAAGSDGG
jgi:hypothetical protein